MTRKDGRLVRNPVPAQPERVGRNARQKEWTKWLESLYLFDGELQSFAYSFSLGVLILEQDQPCSQLSSGAFRRLCYNVLVQDDLLGFSEACSSLRSELVQCGDLATALSKVPRSRWVRGLSSAIRHALDVSLCVHPSVEFNRLATFLGWLKRIPLRTGDRSDAIDRYYEGDRRLSSVRFDDSVHLPLLRKIWEEWLSEFELTDLNLARHGSGSTADVGNVRAHKWAAMVADPVADVCLRNPRLEKLVQMPIGTPARVSKVTFVPKQLGKNRTICMEPAWLQYLQQGVSRSLVAYVHSHRQMSSYIDFRDQTRNQRLCARAYTEGLATIDLSDASDSVSWRLISALTQQIPLRRYLVGTRSPNINVGGHIVQMDKYAPMGSALCFPIESILFASIVELAYRLHYGQASRGYHSGCSVYGDDIICPAEIYTLVQDLLQEFGFIVNTGKSFGSGGYYESCGVEYLYGVRIETIRHPRKSLFSQQALSPEQVDCVIDLSNNLMALGLYDARRFLLVDYAKKSVLVGRKSIAFFDAVKFGEGGLHPIIHPYLARYRVDRYQRSFNRYYAIGASPARTNYDYMGAKFMQPRRTRAERLRDLVPCFRQTEPAPELSIKAVRCLSKFGFPELVEAAGVESVGTPGTGRLRRSVSMQLYTLV